MVEFAKGSAVKARTQMIKYVAGSVRAAVARTKMPNCEESALPFSGELIQVRDGEQAWVGTAERLRPVPSRTGPYLVRSDQ
ncbi:hypothetical protein OG800_07910 [Streptomyces sp. NBC_00445]|uniref:hypothetical protein n=1 Tax=Streptomyces sp. NBC_00445 TaxID=2975745 RepID=UPI002E1BAC93